MSNAHERALRVGFGRRFLAPLFAGVMLNPINSTMIAVALLPIGRSYRVGLASTTWLVAGLYLACAIAQPVMGRLADRLGARRVYMTGIGLVAIAGLAGALAPTLGMLVGARVVIGIGTSAAYPAAMSIVRAQSRRIGRDAPGSVLGTLSLAGLISAGIGPALGGALVALAGWRSIFLINLPLAAAGIALTLWWLPADEPATGAREHVVRELDPLGIALFGGAVGVLLVFLMGLGQPDWLALGGFAALWIALGAWELRTPRPFLDMRMLGANRALLSTYARYVVTFLVIYGVLYGFPQWLEQARRMSPGTAGLVLVPMFVVAAIANQLGARSRRVRGPLLIGTTAMLAGSVALLLVGSGTPIVLLAAIGALVGIANGLNVVANQSALYAQAPPEQIGTASGLFRTAQYVGSIFSASLIGIAYGSRASDQGLGQLALAFLALSLILLAGTALDRTIRSHPSERRGRAPGRPPRSRPHLAAGK